MERTEQNITTEITPKNSELLIRIKGLKKYYPVQRGFWSRTTGYIKALNNINLDIYKGQIIGIVGESGCGKSTLGKLLVRLIDPTEGEVIFKGKNIFSLPNKELRALRQRLQIVFQNPYSSLNPRMKICDIVSEPIIVHKLIKDKHKVEEKVNELLLLVGLEPSMGIKYPHELSGGQRQRVAIARALSLNPEFLILDEPVSALDVSIQAQILNLLLDLHKKLNLTYLFISHNLQVVSYISTKIAVMYLGHIVEYGSKEKILKSSLHPYTAALLSSAPKISTLYENKDNTRKRIILSGEIPSPASPPSGCIFHTRCPIVKENCKNDIPLLTPLNEQLVSCHYPGEVKI